MESEGRVWVEVGSGNDGGGLKLRVIHLHPDNPAIADAVQLHKATVAATAAAANNIKTPDGDVDESQLDEVCNFIIIIIIKKDYQWQGRERKIDTLSLQRPPAPHYQPIEEKKRKVK